MWDIKKQNRITNVQGQQKPRNTLNRKLEGRSSRRGWQYWDNDEEKRTQVDDAGMIYARNSTINGTKNCSAQI